MARKMQCDNPECDNEVEVNNYGNISDEEEPNWYNLVQEEKIKYTNHPNLPETEEVINKELNLELCSLTCVAEVVDNYNSK